MSKTFIVCSILALEVEKAMGELGLCNKICYIPGALHVDLDKMQYALTENLNALKSAGEPTALIVGTKCHPEIRKIAANYGAGIICGSNCIELLLGEEKMKELDNESKTFYLTSGWLREWRDIFCEGGLGWDSTDAKINFGRYDRILMLDTGLIEFSVQDILDFFEYTEVPIDTYPVTLDHLKKKMLEIVD
jgi:hypothetical protein